MFMTKLFKNGIIFFAVCMFAVACKKEVSTQNTEPKPESKSAIAQKWDTSVTKVSGIIATALKSKSFREYLKAETLKAFDGDYDVLLSKVVKDVKAQSTQNNASRLASDYTLNGEQLAYLQGISGDFPQMQLSVQVDPADWNTVTYTPPVVYTASDYNESTSTTVPVVDEYGNIVSYMDATIDPVQPVVIVSENERTIIGANGEIVLEQPAGPYGTEGVMQADSLTPINPNTPLQWYRQNFKYETIYSIGFWDIGKIEGWPAGGPELRTYYYNALDTTGTNYQTSGYYAGQRWAKRKDVKDKWYDFPNEKLITTHLWRWGQTGTTFKYAFYEWDSEPLNQQVTDSIASFITGFARLDSTGALATPLQLAASAVRLVGLFLPREGRLSEPIGEIEISANNNATEFHLATGGFGFRSKPY
jgi:hypothetical protein